MSTVKKIFAQTVYTAGHDLSKRWFIRIKIPDYKTGALSWKKCYGDVNKFSTVEDRLDALNKLLAEIDKNQGYTTISGSRSVGFVNENYYTSTIFQFKKRLECRRHYLRLSTVRRYSSLVKKLEAWLMKGGRPQLPIGSFSNSDAQEFLRFVVTDDKQSGGSHNQHLRLFKGFCNELINEAIIKTNPFAGIRGMAKQNVPALYFGKPQVEILKEVIPQKNPQLWLFVNFIYYAFIRPGELRQLVVGDINFDDARIRMRPSVSKNKKDQYVSIPFQLMQMLLQAGIHKLPKDYYVFGTKGKPGPTRISANIMKWRHQTILRDMNFSTEHKLYSWKHTGAIACARAGMPLKDLQMQLRHHSLDQVDKYLRNMLVWESDFIKNSYPSI